MSHDNTLRDEAGEMKPSNSRKSSEGSVIDPRSGKYPSTIDFAKEATHERVDAASKARRPGGAFRKGHPFKPPSCKCDCHPCRCGVPSHADNTHHKQY